MLYVNIFHDANIYGLSTFCLILVMLCPNYPTALLFLHESLQASSFPTLIDQLVLFLRVEVRIVHLQIAPGSDTV